MERKARPIRTVRLTFSFIFFLLVIRLCVHLITEKGRKKLTVGINCEPAGASERN